VSATVTEGNGNEREALAQNLQPGRLHVKDRGYADYSLMQKILDAGSHFVVRLRDDSVWEVREERELSQEALAAGVVRDAVVHLGGSRSGRALRQPVRIVEVACTPHDKTHKTGRGGPQQGDTILIATDRMDLPPEVISLIDRNRWAIEIFFRTFKHLLGCRYLLSTCRNGIELQMYAAILACMLLALYTGRRPTPRTYEMINWYFMGWAYKEEIQQHINGLKTQV
jgi:IS4 transposase